MTKKIEVELFDRFNPEDVLRQVAEAESMILWAQKEEPEIKLEVECVKEVKKYKPFMTRLIFQFLP